MAREVSRFEAETDPPTIHDTLREAVAAEISAIMGWKGGGENAVIGHAKLLVDQAPDVIACLAQLTPEITAPSQGE